MDSRCCWLVGSFVGAIGCQKDSPDDPTPHACFVDPLAFGRQVVLGAPASVEQMPVVAPSATALFEPAPGTWYAHQVSMPSVLGSWMAFAGTDQTLAENKNPYWLGMARLDGDHVSEVSPGHLLEHGPDGAWDHQGHNGPFLLEVDGGYQLFYQGVATDSGGLSIGRATSDDGWTWTADSGNPVLTTTGAADGTGDGHPTLIVPSEGPWEMWFATGSHTVGFALSDDQGATWWPWCDGDVLGVEDDVKTPEVRWLGDRYGMSFARGRDQLYELAWAESWDGISWTVADAPMLSPGTAPWQNISVVNGQLQADGSVVYAATGTQGSGIGWAR